MPGKIRARRAHLRVAVAALTVLCCGHAFCSQESADRATQQALALDAHPDRGSLLYARYCARCHGSEAQGNASRAIPALAAQRLNYLVRQQVNLDEARRHNVDADLVRFLKGFDEEEMIATAVYLSCMHGPAEDHKVMRSNGVVVD